MKANHLFTLAATTLLVAAGPAAHAVPAVSGRPVPELADFDDTMTTFMDANSITAGVLGLIQDGRIVYLRGFGDDYDGNPLPENALMRIASLTKPLAASVIRDLAADGEFDTTTDLAFDLGQPAGGVLNYTPFQNLVDNRLQNTTIEDLLNHQGGWDHDTDNDGSFENNDWTYQEVTVANQMGIGSPPGRIPTMRYILGQPLQQNPGTGSSGTTYSNHNYLALGLIAEQVSGQGLISYLRQNIVTPWMWVPGTEIIQGRTFRAWQNPREPEYDDPTQVTNVYDPDGDTVERPYGGWDHDARIGQGGIVLSAATMLTFADNYRVGYSGGNVGQPLADFPLGANQWVSHTGSMPSGTTSAIRQRGDGYRIFVAFNRRNPVPGSANYANTMVGVIHNYLDNNAIPAINRTSDGFWTMPSGGVGTNVGGYHQPFHSVMEMLSGTTSGSKIRFLPGSSGWTGKIKKRMRFDAPLGVAKIGA
jgi:CubicO group peptidase (beta-lactamase class C family)